MSQSVGERLREERRKTGLNQHAFGELGGVGRHSQDAYESGKTAPNTDYLERIAAAGIDAAYVLTGQRAVDSLSGNEGDLLTAFRAVPAACQAALLILAGQLKDGRTPSSALSLIANEASASVHAPTKDYRAG